VTERESTNPNDHPDRRSTMTTKTANTNANATTKLTPTQEAILKAAASRPDGNIEPLPDNVTPGVRQRVIDGMLSRALVMRFPGGIHRISSYGYECIGMEPPSKSLVKASTKDKPSPKKRGKASSPPKDAAQPATGATTPLDAALAKPRPGNQAGNAARAPVAPRGRVDRRVGRGPGVATTHCEGHHEPHAEKAARADDHVREGRRRRAAVSGLTFPTILPRRRSGASARCRSWQNRHALD